MNTSKIRSKCGTALLSLTDKSRVAGLFFALLFCTTLTPTYVDAGGPQYEIKLATLAPENSSMVRIFKEMNAELLKETDGRVGFKIFAGFALGDEQDLLRKLRIGLINAATFTSTFLANVNPVNKGAV